jgi:imidazole glycerol-phosphate synthase subunit HisH
MITIIDYGIGNLASIKNMLRKIGVESVIASDEKAIAEASKIILPGVGHFDYGMKKLKASGCFDMLNKKALGDKIPVLGICLGAQLLTKGSEEGNEPGLEWIDAETIRFDLTKFETKLPVPHMGWSEVIYKQHPLFENMYDLPRFYFVHSYCLHPKNEANILCQSVYGYQFTSGIQHENIFGVQFHPEKSHKFGIRLLENFSKI